MKDIPPATNLSIDVWPTKRLASAAAATAAAGVIRSCLQREGRARIMVATGNSQTDLVAFLAAEKEIDWSRVEAFHLDEYVGVSADHPASFRRWIRTRFAERMRPSVMHYIEGDAPNLDAELQRYAKLLTARPVDLAFVGIGENGHIAFNDPALAEFADPLVIKQVQLDQRCREQQVSEGHFPTLADVPPRAITVTCSGLLRVKNWICCVPEERKAVAVQRSLEGEVTPDCPGSLVQRHPAAVFLDFESASLLDAAFVSSRCRVHRSPAPAGLN